MHRAGVLAAGVAAWVAVLGAVLAPLQLWRVWIALPLLVAGLVPLVRWVRRMPDLPGVPAWTTAAVWLIAAGHTAWAVATHAQHVVLRRDAGSYALYTHWIAEHHGLPVQASPEAFGAALGDPALSLASPAFFQVGEHLVPQFLIGAPAWFSFGWWAGGWTGVFAAPAVASGLALLAFAGLAARLAGPRWAVLATAVLAVCQPVIHAARSTYSEPLALLLVAAAASLLVDAVRAGQRAGRGERAERAERAARADGDGQRADQQSGDGWQGQAGRARRLALAAGGLAGLAGLVRVDAVREIALLLPVAAVLALRRHPAAGPLVRGALGGIVLAAAWALLMSRPYLGNIAASLVPLLAGAVVLGLGSLLVVRRGALPGRRAVARLVPRPDRVAGGLVLAVWLVLLSRPLWMIVRQDPNDPGSRVVAALQRDQGLRIDGGRTYAEHSLTWVAWYLGWVAVLLAGLAFAVLAARAVTWWRSGEREVPLWLGPAVVALGSTLLTLYRPGITPDHPWADRRLVPVVLPAVVLASVGAAAWLAGRLPGRRPVVAAVATLALLGPACWGTAALVGDRTEVGQPGAVEAVCAVLRPGDVVLTVDSRASNEWPQLVRDVCGRPAAAVKVRAQGDRAAQDEATAEAAQRIGGLITEAGGTPVLLSASDDGPTVLQQVASTGGVRQAVALQTTEDERALVARPDGVATLRVHVWYLRLG